VSKFLSRQNLIVFALFALCISSGAACADPVLMLDEAWSVGAAKYSCTWATTFKCNESELCQRAIDINAACKVHGPAVEVQAFHNKLLAQFASNPQCTISIVRFTDDKSDAAKLEVFKQANWQLNIDFIPGAAKHNWRLSPLQSQEVIGGPLEGEGDPEQIARDVCTIMTHRGAKILN
jgi:hypothetical protein